MDNPMTYGGRLPGEPAGNGCEHGVVEFYLDRNTEPEAECLACGGYRMRECAADAGIFLPDGFPDCRSECDPEECPVATRCYYLAAGEADVKEALMR